LLSAGDLRIDVGGTPAVDGLSLATNGERVLVLGAPRALFEGAAGLRPTRRGELRIEGMAPLAAVRARLAAGAPLDPPLPPRWTVAQYVTWSARLAGHGARDAARLAGDALDALQLGSSAVTKLRLAPLAMRRATVIAAALATAAPAILLDDPLTALPEDAARSFARVLVRSLDAPPRRRAVVFAARIPLESPLSLAADEALVIDGSHVSAHGPPAEVAAQDKTVALRVEGDVAAFARAVQAEGGRATVGTPPGEEPTRTMGPTFVRVELGPLGARELMRIAEQAQAVVRELRPITGVFA
jgi:ABC-type multidrug transport system ATPase subunit